ncbi:leucine-rich repeats and immunoglobulin-like domains protein 3 [Dinothrombium tinctorium]|uniref:Leucine-rich repeats and immunoglobulin-like domains protein 3 n=1 Tax=Dinothrombium tinctorium TaxID=1965070 RepID=A0A3S3NRM6_9ACAR|nr:leucine-rich repeats and immunoglobulin-like domains protein 3 [Dinothrombium tinctorium]RWS04684.1 leucine-rich repeats and immunoglobulin-like domains protein 3 [Dinothrombium tinctorium]RWS08901.1 leucine-rich repeats and immunoglobulin-like domains protein 3 [Dinothrombium tinctorium]
MKPSFAVNANQCCFMPNIVLLIAALFAVRTSNAAFENNRVSNELRSNHNQCAKLCSCLGNLVDCSRRKLTRVPNDIPEWVEILDLSQNAIAYLHRGSFNRLLLLRKIDLSHNKLTEISDDLFIQFSNESSSTTSSSPSFLSLEELQLNNNFLDSFPNVNNLPNLRSLVLHHNNISTLVNSSVSVYTNLEVLDLSYNRITNIPYTFLNSTKLKTVLLSNNRLSIIENGSFDRLSELINLKLAKNRLTSFPKDLFRQMCNLRYLDLSRNKLRQIEGLTFMGLEKLESLKIKRNELSLLLDGAFYELPSLQTLHLDHNNLTQIRRGWLYGLTNLKQLQLKHNQIAEIEGDSWEFCKHLWELDLSHNRLQTLKKDSFHRLQYLQYLYLNQNLILVVEESSFKYMSQLAVLELNHNQISWMIEDANAPFMGLEKLEHLGLSHNHIKSISKLAFIGLPSLLTLDLLHNPITWVEDEAFMHFKHLHELRLNSTNLLCDCNIKWFVLWLKSRSMSKHQVSDAKCKHPQWLSHRSLIEVNISDLTCQDFPKPYVTEEPLTQIALKGSNTTLTCKASSSSPMHFEWRKNNVLLEGKSINTFAHTWNESVLEYTSVLHLIDTQYEDEGKYQCIISNQYGTAYSQKARITVNVLPSFTKRPADVVVKVGSTAKLECAAKGHPVPEIAWQKDGGIDFPAARERRMHVMPSDDVFFIVEAKAADAGVYSCTAQNDAGSVVVNASLTVLETPSFVKKMKDKVARVGETAVLECKAIGSPKPVLKWKKDDSDIVTTDRHFFTFENQLLIIGEVQLSDAGKYSCEMNNLVGSARDSAYLKVIEYDPPVTNVQVNELTNSNSKWSSIFNDNQTFGIVVIAFVSCFALFSLFFIIIIIYKTRKRSDDF